jgi:MoxR-like ATPase
MKKIKLSPAKIKFVKCAQSLYGEEAVISKKQVQDVTSDHNLGLPSWFTRSPFTVNRGMYRLPNLDGNLDIEVSTIPTKSSSKSIVAFAKPEKKETPEMVSNVIEFPKNTESYVPEKVNGYVKFGHYNDVKIIKKAGSFYPVFITGLSGNGKTMMIEQVHSELKKELFRVNITIETDEDDLIGHYALIDGRTVWQDGPVVMAMERGATLLLDEVDLASNKIMCLQPVLEGNPLLIKKEGRIVRPKSGFTVMATANTKGKGSEDGRFIGTNILNEAFLERFPITLEQEYPTISVEKNIIKKLMSNLGCLDEEYATKLVDWADLIRKTFYDGGVDEIFKDRMKAISMCVARFDDQTKDTFMDLYSKLDETVTLEEPEEVKPVVEEVEDYS